MSTFNYYKDKYDLVKVFCIVFEHDGHFTKAAEAMQTGRQAISAKMKTLEEDMKCTFFVQNGSIMVPTKKAEELLISEKKVCCEVSPASTLLIPISTPSANAHTLLAILK